MQSKTKDGQRAGFVAASVLAGVGLVALAVTGGVMVGSHAGAAVQPDKQPDTQPQPQDSDDAAGMMGAMEGMAFGMKMIAGLRESEGCLGVEMGRMMSGKTTIIAWFENKAAVKDWYYGVAHEQLLDDVMPTDEPLDHEPLAFVEDETTPIMVIATLTFAKEPAFEAINMPISQVSVELFAPLPGGAFLGGRLSPEGFKVEHMVDLAK